MFVFSNPGRHCSGTRFTSFAFDLAHLGKSRRSAWCTLSTHRASPLTALPESAKVKKLPITSRIPPGIPQARRPGLRDALSNAGSGSLATPAFEGSREAVGSADRSQDRMIGILESIPPCKCSQEVDGRASTYLPITTDSGLPGAVITGVVQGVMRRGLSRCHQLRGADARNDRNGDADARRCVNCNAVSPSTMNAPIDVVLGRALRAVRGDAPRAAWVERAAHHHCLR